MIHPSFTVVLLTAGKSSRMGRMKALLPWKGKTLIEHQISQLLESNIDQIIVVTGYKSSLIQSVLEYYPVKTIYNPLYDSGKTSSIKCGLKEVSSNFDGIFFISVDQPVSKNSINQMIAHFDIKRKSILIPTYNQKRGHPILFSSSFKSELLQIDEATEGLRSVIQHNKDQIQEIEIKDEKILFNFNTYDEYLLNKK